MTDGFIKTAAGTIDVQVADVQTNTDTILARVRQADAAGVDLLTLPELCLTGYTCGDLFLQETLLRGAEEGLKTILEATKNLDMITDGGAFHGLHRGPAAALRRQAL